MQKRLYKIEEGKKLDGVCGGIADYMDADVSMVRLIAILLLFCAGGSLWLYIILMLIVPEEPVRKIDLNKNK